MRPAEVAYRGDLVTRAAVARHETMLTVIGLHSSSDFAQKNPSSIRNEVLNSSIMEPGEDLSTPAQIAVALVGFAGLGRGFKQRAAERLVWSTDPDTLTKDLRNYEHEHFGALELP